MVCIGQESGRLDALFYFFHLFFPCVSLFLPTSCKIKGDIGFLFFVVFPKTNILQAESKWGRSTITGVM